MDLPTWHLRSGIPINFLRAVFDSNEGKKELPAIGTKVSQETQQRIKQTVQAILVKMAPVITRYGHAGIINILTFSREQFPNKPVEAVVGGLHLFPANDDQLNWTADKMKDSSGQSAGGASPDHRGGVPNSRTTRPAPVIGSSGWCGIELRAGGMPTSAST
jgi:hypothetical protein